MSAYYNEIDPFAGDWITALAAAGHVTAGAVDRRDIREVNPDDVRSYRRAHFFAGIAGWDYALRLAGWPDDAPVWTGSCPCQPFSAAGRKKGVADERHLWPKWFRLIRECRPPVVFGEQVASPDGLAWFDLVSADLEGAGYAVGAADLCAAGVGAPHIRQRLYFVAYTDGERCDGLGLQLRERAARPAVLEAGRGGEVSVGLDTDDARPQGRLIGRDGADERAAGPGGVAGELADAWRRAEWVPCRDGKRRPVEPGTFPLAHGVPGRVGRLRGYGNAIVPQVAATFIRAAVQAVSMHANA